MTNKKNTPASGTTIREWTEFGHTFRIEKLSEPRLVGAGLRGYRLHHDGSPATGGQWHYSVEDAERRARYVLETDYARRVEFLENSVNRLQGQLHVARIRIAELETAAVAREGASS